MVKGHFEPKITEPIKSRDGLIDLEIKTIQTRIANRGKNLFLPLFSWICLDIIR
jgi:hypothetical protein